MSAPLSLYFSHRSLRATLGRLAAIGMSQTPIKVILGGKWTLRASARNRHAQTLNKSTLSFAWRLDTRVGYIEPVEDNLIVIHIHPKALDDQVELAVTDPEKTVRTVRNIHVISPN